MVEVGGRPIIWPIMRLYAHHGFQEFVLCLVGEGFVWAEMPELVDSALDFRLTTGRFVERFERDLDTFRALPESKGARKSARETLMAVKTNE
jgi:hypothetical protein